MNIQNDQIEKILECFDKTSLWISLRAICENPQHELRVERPFVDVGQVKEMDAALLGLSAMEPGSVILTERMAHFSSHGKKWRFLKVYDRRIVRYSQTQANLFVAWFIRNSLKLLKTLSYQIVSDEDLMGYFEHFQRIIRRLNGLLSLLPMEIRQSQLTEVPLDNQILQFDPRYHVILETWLEMEGHC